MAFGKDNTAKGKDHLFVLANVDSNESEKITAPNYSYWRSVFRSFFSKKSNYVMLTILLIIILFAYIHPLISGFTMDGANINNPDMRFLDPFTTYKGKFYIFGTDDRCDSLFAAIWAGTKTSLSLSFIAAAVNMTVGTIVGSFWGYSKTMDKIMTEVYNVVSNVPFILFVTVFMYIVGSGFWQLVLAFTITNWLGIAYFIRTQVIIIRDREYNLASRCLGTPISRMVSRNILPYMTSVIVTLLSREIPSYISYEVFLSYIGVGMGVNIPSLGRMIQNYATWMDQKPYVFWIPVAVAALVSITLYVVGQNLADSSDPKTHMM